MTTTTTKHVLLIMPLSANDHEQESLQHIMYTPYGSCTIRVYMYVGLYACIGVGLCNVCNNVCIVVGV